MAQEHCESGIGGSWERRGGRLGFARGRAEPSKRSGSAERARAEPGGRPGEAARGGGPGRAGGGAGSWGLLARGSHGSFALASWFAPAFAAAAATGSTSFAAARSTAAPPAMAAAGARRSPGPSSGLWGRPRLGFHPAPPLLVLLLLLPPPLLLAGAPAAASRGPDSPCRLKTVTVSTLPALRESDLGWSGARSGAGTGTGTGAGAGAAAASSPGSASSSGGTAESRLLLFVRNELPGRIAVQDDLDNTELPFFTLGKAGRQHTRDPKEP